MTRSWEARDGPHVVNCRNCVSEQHMAECPSDYGKNNANLKAGLSQGPGREDLGSSGDRSPYPNIPPKGSFTQDQQNPPS